VGADVDGGALDARVAVDVGEARDGPALRVVTQVESRVDGRRARQEVQIRVRRDQGGIDEVRQGVREVPWREGGAEVDVVADLDVRIAAAADGDVRLAGRGPEDVVLDGDRVAVVLELNLAEGALARGVVDDEHVVSAAAPGVVAAHQDVTQVAPRDEVV